VFYPEIDLNEWDLKSKKQYFKNDDNQYDFTLETYERL
jgi:hypothetical protein